MLKNIFKFKNITKNINPSKKNAMRFISGGGSSGAESVNVEPKNLKVPSGENKNSLVSNLDTLNRTNAFEILDFFGSKRTEKRLRDSVKRLRNSLVNTFDIAAILKSVILGITKKLKEAPSKLSGAGRGGVGGIFNFLRRGIVNIIGNIGSKILGFLGSVLRIIPGLGKLAIPALVIGGVTFAAGKVIPNLFPETVGTETDKDVDERIDEIGGQATADELRAERDEKNKEGGFFGNLYRNYILGEKFEYDKQIRRAEESSKTDVTPPESSPSFIGPPVPQVTPGVTPQTPMLGGQSSLPKMPEDERELLLKLMIAEAGGEGQLGMAAVARSVMNRSGLIQSGSVSPGTFMSRSGSIKDVITAEKQYQPVVGGRVMQDGGTTDRELTQDERVRAESALKLAGNVSKLQSELRAAGKTETEIKNISASTGFRTHNAYRDPSQEVNVTSLGGHRFNTAGNESLMVPKPNPSLVKGDEISMDTSSKVKPVAAKPTGDAGGNIAFFPLGDPGSDQPQQQSGGSEIIPTSMPGGGSPSIAFLTPFNPDSYEGLSGKLIYNLVDA